MDTTVAFALIGLAFVVGYIFGGMRSKTPALGVPPEAPPDAAVLHSVRPIFEREGKIAAIKAYREKTGVGLRDAKLAVDTLHG